MTFFYSLQKSQLHITLYFYSYIQCSFGQYYTTKCPGQCLVRGRCSRIICWINKWMKSDDSIFEMFPEMWTLNVANESGAILESLCYVRLSLWPRYPFILFPRANLGWAISLPLLIVNSVPGQPYWKCSLLCMQQFLKCFHRHCFEPQSNSKENSQVHTSVGSLVSESFHIPVLWSRKTYSSLTCN